MVPDVIALGEVLVEILRKDLDVPHKVSGVYMGPYPSGAPAIFIDTAARIGVSTGFIGVVGDDEFGELLIDRLKGDGVDTQHVRVAQGYTTGTAFVMYYSSGNRKFIFHLRHSAAGQLSPDDVKEEYIAGSKILHVMGSSLAVNRSSREACYKAARIAHENGLTVTFDPNLRPELLKVETTKKICEPILKLSRIVFPSRTEATTLTDADDPIEAGRRLVKSGPEIAVIKMGAKGAVAVTKREILYELAFNVKELDPTGAGDAYDAAFIYCFLQKWSLRRTLEFASATGALKVTKFGPMDVPASKEEIENFIRSSKKNIKKEERITKP